MYKGKTFLAIIPARGGSKRIPDKNILNIAKKPLIVWTIEAGLKSKYIDTVLVSTDSREIASISKINGAEVPFLRPDYLSEDSSSTEDVVQHAINYLKNNKKAFDYIILLQPTSPLRDSSDIDTAIKFLIQKNADAVISVCECEHSPLWTNTLSKELSMKNFIVDKVKKTRSQDLPKYFRLNGAVFICKTALFEKEKTFYLKDNIFAYIMKTDKSIDIDSKLDFEIASFLLEKKFELECMEMHK